MIAKGFWRILVTAFIASVGAGRVARAAESTPHWSGAYLKQAPEWYRTKEAVALADTLLSYQSPEGAWPKNTDLFKPLTEKELAAVRASSEANTIDNGATTVPLAFLAVLQQNNPQEKYRHAFMRGLDYLFAAQYPNGGWPQFYPLRKG